MTLPLVPAIRQPVTSILSHSFRLMPSALGLSGGLGPVGRHRVPPPREPTRSMARCTRGPSSLSVSRRGNWARSD